MVFRWTTFQVLSRGGVGVAALGVVVPAARVEWSHGLGGIWPAYISDVTGWQTGRAHWPVEGGSEVVVAALAALVFLGVNLTVDRLVTRLLVSLGGCAVLIALIRMDPLGQAVVADTSVHSAGPWLGFYMVLGGALASMIAPVAQPAWSAFWSWLPLWE